MRLLHTKTLRLHEFMGANIPPYAILSHRWESEEVTLQDLINEKGPQLKGWSKIAGCCTRAALDGWEFAWIDSCCIDKTSSAELSEAINSMYAWYKEAQVCYVYLSDVRTGENPEDASADFRKTKWFTRGWTLQELLAPKFLEFYDQNWIEIGSKSSLHSLISKITRISIYHLSYPDYASVAQKMSWASRRETTRIEDEAYCLMGLFGVHMPPLYGEGRNAFLRLQLEILNKSNDETIFAWEYPCDELERIHSRNEDSGLGAAKDFYFGTKGLLALSLAYFENSGDIVYAMFDGQREPPRMTSKGLHFNLSITLDEEQSPMSGRSVYVAPLNCRRQFQKVKDIDFDTRSNTDDSASPIVRAKTNFIALRIMGSWFDNTSFLREASLHHMSTVKRDEDASRFQKGSMYFLQSPDERQTRRSLTSVRVFFESMTNSGFIIIDGNQYRGSVGHDSIEADSDNIPTKSPEIIAPNVVEFRNHTSFGALTFQKSDFQPWVLLVAVQGDLVMIDLFNLPPGMTAKLITQLSWVYSMEYTEAPSVDRVTSMVASGIFVTAALKRMRTPGFDGSAYQVQLVIDDHERWPRSPTQWWDTMSASEAIDKAKILNFSDEEIDEEMTESTST